MLFFMSLNVIPSTAYDLRAPKNAPEYISLLKSTEICSPFLNSKNLFPLLTKVIELSPACAEKA
jgi:hypothetical protein